MSDEELKSLILSCDDYYNNAPDHILDMMVANNDTAAIAAYLKKKFPELPIGYIIDIINDKEHESIQYVEAFSKNTSDLIIKHDELIGVKNDYIESLRSKSSSLSEPVKSINVMNNAGFKILDGIGFKYVYNLEAVDFSELLTIVKESDDFECVDLRTDLLTKDNYTKNIQHFIAIYKITFKDKPQHIMTLLSKYSPEVYKLYTDYDNFSDILKELEEINYLEQYENWNNTEGKKKRLSDYRKLAHLGEKEKITEENIDEFALNKTSFINYDYPKDKLLAELLDELN